jgi:hypothetical protein
MSDQGDLFAGVPLPARGRRARARTRCLDCTRLVYVDQLVYGRGRCCAEKAGLLVVRYRFPHQHQQGPSLLDHLPEGAHVEPYPTSPRIDVAGLGPDAAHTKIVEHARAMISDPSGEIAAAYPNGITAATDDAFRGLANILERHAPDPDGCHRFCSRCVAEATRGPVPVPWPCPDYRDAAAGLATGLPAARA